MRQLLIAVAVLILFSCEKVVFEDEVYSNSDAGGNVTLHLSPIQNVTRSAVLSDVCGRLNVAVFDSDGKKVKTVAQTVADAGFGSVSLSLSDGVYTVIAIGHNCTGSATITSTEKVTFPNNKVTDTFSYCGQLTVTGDRQEVDINMMRAVAMVRIRLTDDANTMANVAQLKFYYLGGSSTLSPSAGFGCVNSKQTEYRAVSDDGVYFLYTLPHTTDDILTKVTITGLDAGDNIVGECTLENVPISTNYITDCNGGLYGGGGSIGISIYINPQWDGTKKFSF